MGNICNSPSKDNFDDIDGHARKGSKPTKND